MEINTPRERRNVFAQNLRQLLGQKSVTQISQELGINRSQFTRYLSGGTTPNPDVLSKICDYFKTDARILLTPISSIEEQKCCPKTKPTCVFGDFLPKTDLNVGNKLPDGFYQLWKWTYTWENKVQAYFLRVFTANGVKQFRGFQPRNGFFQRNLRPTGLEMEIRGVFIAQETSFQLLGHEPSKGVSVFNGIFETQFGSITGVNPGLLMQTQPYASSYRRVAAACLIPVAPNTHAVLKAARQNAVFEFEDASEHIQVLLSKIKDNFRVT